MTSRELTSGFNFWSHGHLCMASVHLPMKFGADIFIQFGFIDIFPNFPIFSRSGLKVLFTPPKFLFLGDFTPKI